MTFAYPWAFLLLIPCLLWQIRMWAVRRREALTYSSTVNLERAPRSLRVRLRWVPNLLRTLALVAVAFALARPQVDEFEAALEKEGVAIELLVDISSSMDMRVNHRGKDASRLAVAKEVIADFVAGNEEGLKGRPDDLIGMVTFARYADTICPLTLSHDAVTWLAEEMTINDRPNEDGTAYGDATALAAARLARLEDRLHRGDPTGPAPEQVKSKIIILLTDGENNCGRILPLQAAALAREWDIRIYTVSLTDPPKSQFVRVDGDETIEAARVRSAAERGLEQMAEMTGGIFRAAYDYDTLQAVYEEIDQLERSRMRSSIRRVKGEVFHWFVLGALILMSGELTLRSTWLRQIP